MRRASTMEGHTVAVIRPATPRTRPRHGREPHSHSRARGAARPLRAQPQADVRGLPGLVDGGPEVIRDGVDVQLVAKMCGECVERAG